MTDGIRLETCRNENFLDQISRYSESQDSIYRGIISQKPKTTNHTSTKGESILDLLANREKLIEIVTKIVKCGASHSEVAESREIINEFTKHNGTRVLDFKKEN